MAKKSSKKVARGKAKIANKSVDKKFPVKKSRLKSGTFWFVNLVLIVVFLYGVYLIFLDFANRLLDGIALMLAAVLIFLVIKLIRKLARI